MTAGALRSDAFSSVQRILDAARRIFSSEDSAAPLSRIADEAGVGIATLYRHFPNRQALAKAVYDRIFAAEVEPLLDEFGRSNMPRSALLDVVEHLTEIVQREHGVMESLGNLAEVTRDFFARYGDLLAPALERAKAAGNLRSDIESSDVPNLLAMFTSALGTVANDKALRRRYLGLLLDALNPAQAEPLPH